MNLQEQVLDRLSNQMCKSIDRHIIAGSLIENGWIEIVVDPWQHDSSIKINNWCDSHCKHNWFKESNRWLFENEKDAIIFRLKWG